MSRLERQSFPGASSDAVLRRSTIGFVGLGGGGSHIVQQSGHLGVGGYVVVDPDHITDTNTNRLVGGRLTDLATNTKPAMSKVDIAERTLHGLIEEPRIVPICDTWHNATDQLKRCDIIVGAVDSFRERDQLERFARRHLVPYIDIGMDVHELPSKRYLIAGQVVLSIPGKPCLRCCEIVTDERLAGEARLYGAAGSRPQVVWSNGVLASTAVGLITQLLTPWFVNTSDFAYLDYDGNLGTLTPNLRMKHLRGHSCPHHPPNEVGDPFFDVREFVKRRAELVSAKQLPPRATTSRWERLGRHISRLLSSTKS